MLILDLLRAIEENQDDSIARLNLVRALWEEGLYSFARREAETLLSLNPDNESIRLLADKLGVNTAKFSQTVVADTEIEI
jgi:uncharacterized membrane-anchored protein